MVVARHSIVGGADTCADPVVLPMNRFNTCYTRGWRPMDGVRVVHTEDGFPVEAWIRRADFGELLVLTMRACVDRWGRPVRADRYQVMDPRHGKGVRRLVRLRRFLVAEPRYVATPHGTEVFGYRVVLDDGTPVDLDDAGVPDPVQMQRDGTLDRWLGGYYDVVCQGHGAPIAQCDRPDRFDRFPERDRSIPELRAVRGPNGEPVVSRHRRVETYGV